MRRIKVAVWLAFVAGMLLWPLLSCGTNPPTPDPGPVPGQVDAAQPYAFDGMVADCAADSAQSPSVLSPASSCLAGFAPVDGCLSDLLTTWPGDAIACAVRALGIRAAISVAGGDAGATDRSVAPAARAWILGHGIMYRN
jgi:hypothetical protein